MPIAEKLQTARVQAAAPAAAHEPRERGLRSFNTKVRHILVAHAAVFVLLLGVGAISVPIGGTKLGREFGGEGHFIV